MGLNGIGVGFGTINGIQCDPQGDPIEPNSNLIESYKHINGTQWDLYGLHRCK